MSPSKSNLLANLFLFVFWSFTGIRERTRKQREKKDREIYEVEVC